MKKLILFAASMLLAVNLFAQTYTVEDFNLEVGGVAVTVGNADNVFAGDDFLDGKVRFDAENKTLILEDANILGPIVVAPALPELQQEFTIKLIGYSTLKSVAPTHSAIFSQVEHTTIYSAPADKGSLRASGQDEVNPAHGIYCGAAGDKELIISGASVLASSNNDFAIVAGNIRIENGSDLMAETEGIGMSALSEPLNVALSETELVYPSTASVPNGQTVWFAPVGAKEERYLGAKVNGVPVTEYNMWDVLEDGTGRVAWMYGEDMLVLFADGGAVSIEGAESGVPAVELEKPATIYFLDGACAIKAGHNAPAIKTNSDLKFAGTAAGEIFGDAGYPTVIEFVPGDKDVTLTFDKVEVQIKDATDFSISKDDASAGNLTIEATASIVYLEQNVKNVEDIKLNDCYYFDGDDWIVQDGQIYDSNMSIAVAGSILITASEYPIEIAGSPITAKNKNDIFNDGLVQYDDKANTLIFKNSCSMSNADVPFINVLDGDLTVIFDGDVYLKTENREVIRFNAGKTGHKLTLIANKHAWVSLYTENDAAEPAHGILDAYGNDVEFNGIGYFSLYAEMNEANESPLIWANNMYINTVMEVGTDYDASGTDILNVTNIVLHEYMVLNGTDYVLESGKVVWADSKTDPIIGPISFYIKELDAVLSIAGVMVNFMNKDDILGDGKVKYNPDTHALILDNAKIFDIPDYTPAINWSYNLAPLTILVKGNCEITHYGMNYLILATGNVIFAGLGEGKHSNLTLFNTYAEDSGPYGVMIDGDFVRLANGVAVDILVNNTDRAALVIDGGEARLEVDNGDLRVATEVSTALSAIECKGLGLGEGVTFRTDDGLWPLTSWDGGSMEFVSSDPTHIWIGKSEEFPMPMDIANMNVPADKAVKVLYNGQIYIIRGEKMYSITGMELK